MSGVWGKNIQLAIFGESHGTAIGGVLSGLTPGIVLSEDKIRRELLRRAPGRNKMSTPRKETDEFQILSGVKNGVTTGAPLSFLIPNTNTKSGDYNKMMTLVRPGHADYTGNVRYRGFNDIRGGGHFSGRLTAVLVFAGAVAAQALENSGVYTASHVLSIGSTSDKPFSIDVATKEKAEKLKEMVLPTLDADKAEQMQAEIEQARKDADSVGGVIECAVMGLPAGIGNPFFDSFESRLSALLFSVPAVKGVAFGAGFEMSAWHGSVANDSFYMDGETVKTRTNHNGGINGGITNGMPVVFTTAIKPTPSIGIEQDTVDISTKTDAKLKVEGRHDPCIVQRAVPVIEACATLVVLDLSMTL